MRGRYSPLTAPFPLRDLPLRAPLCSFYPTAAASSAHLTFRPAALRLPPRSHADGVVWLASSALSRYRCGRMRHARWPRRNHSSREWRWWIVSLGIWSFHLMSQRSDGRFYDWSGDLHLTVQGRRDYMTDDSVQLFGVWHLLEKTYHRTP